jgi:hypothetical protein
MTPEERFERIERQLEFLAENQAHHDSHLSTLTSTVGDLAGSVGGLAGSVGGLADAVEGLAGRVGELTDLTLRIARIVEEQANRMDRTDERISALAQRLDVLIDVVERYLSNGRK